MSKRGHLIWINGYPGVGKYTIAKELHRLLPGSVLVDNHSLIDQVTLARDHPDYNCERERVRDATYRRLVYPETDEESKCGDVEEEQLGRVVILIFTGTCDLRSLSVIFSFYFTVSMMLNTYYIADCFTDGELGTKWSTAAKTAAERGSRPFLPVYLACSKEENLKRVVSPGRKNDDRRKLTDVKMVEGFLDKLTMFRFAGLGIDVNVTELTPAEAAERIIRAMGVSDAC